MRRLYHPYLRFGHSGRRLKGHPVSRILEPLTPHFKADLSQRGIVRMQRLTQPSYQQGLGAIGRYLDQYGFEDLLLCELDDGFVGRVTQAGKLVEAIPFPLADLQSMVRQPGSGAGQGSPADRAPRASGSFVRRAIGAYRDFLSALGSQCDLLQASTILIVELPDEVLVTFRVPMEPNEAPETASREFLYDDAGVRQLLIGAGSPAGR